MPTRKLILASTSRYRRQLLERLGVPFEVRAPDVDEDAWRHLPPVEMARRLAELKARAAAAAGALVIGSDQVVDLDGAILTKPGTVEAAIAQLERLRGRAHRLITAVTVYDPDADRVEAEVDVHTLTMRADLPRELLERYVAHDQPLDCAGSYRLEGRGIALFARIEADPELADDSAIVGLPLAMLCRALRRHGVEVLAC